MADLSRRTRATDLAKLAAPIIGITEAAMLLGVDQRTVRRFISEGKLPAYRVGNKVVRLKRTDVEALLVPIIPRNTA